jgi:hypothetical protein
MFYIYSYSKSVMEEGTGSVSVSAQQNLLYTGNTAYNLRDYYINLQVHTQHQLLTQ